MQKRLLIVGGSYAASELAAQARQSGYEEEILIVSDEQDLPYHRPPLSKSFLKDITEDVMPLRGEAFYNEKGIKFELNTRVLSVDGNRKQAHLSNGVSLSYDVLALATGAKARILPGLPQDSSNVFYVRSVDDARLLRTRLIEAAHIVIIGAGFIGLEIASALAQQNKKITVVEMADRVLARAVSPIISRMLTEMHTHNGVTIRTSSSARPRVNESGLVDLVELDDGSILPADLLVVGIGSEANLELAKQLELEVSNGIVVNNQSRTSRPDVYAAGDCTTFKSRFNPTGIRLESVQNATDQARVAGDAIAGGGKIYDSLPWFWSDQYQYKIQIAGLSAIGDDLISINGSDGEVSVFHFRNDTCVCVESINKPRDHIAARRLLGGGFQVTLNDLKAVEFNMPELLKAQTLKQS